jgi:hypothetical protein
MPCSTRAWYDVTPEAGSLYIPEARKSSLEFEYPVYENTNEMLGFAIRFSFRGARLSRMWRLLQHLSGLRTILWWWLWWRSSLWRTLLRGLSGLRHCGGGRSALLPPRGGLLCRPHLLRLETRTLGIAERAASLDPRPLRRARRILDRCLAFRLMVNDRLRQAAARKTEPQSCCQTA